MLSNLVWTARQEMGKPGTASFAIGSVTVAGQALPIPAGVAPADVLKTVNDALVPVGLRLEVPVTAADAAGANVSSLVIQVRNPETVATLVGQATQPAVPVLNQMLDTLLAAAPDAAASRLVVNALLATGTTRGGGRLELGGAAARIGNVEVADLPAPTPPPVDAVEAPPAFTLPAAAAAAAPRRLPSHRFRLRLRRQRRPGTSRRCPWPHRSPRPALPALLRQQRRRTGALWPPAPSPRRLRAAPPHHSSSGQHSSPSPSSPWATSSDSAAWSAADGLRHPAPGKTERLLWTREPKPRGSSSGATALWPASWCCCSS